VKIQKNEYNISKEYLIWNKTKKNVSNIMLKLYMSVTTHKQIKWLINVLIFEWKCEKKHISNAYTEVQEKQLELLMEK